MRIACRASGCSAPGSRWCRGPLGCVPAMPTANWLLAWDQSSPMLPGSKESKCMLSPRRWPLDGRNEVECVDGNGLKNRVPCWVVRVLLCCFNRLQAASASSPGPRATSQAAARRGPQPHASFQRASERASGRQTPARRCAPCSMQYCVFALPGAAPALASPALREEEACTLARGQPRRYARWLM